MVGASLPTLVVVDGPAAGAWRTARGAVLALLCCTVPLLGHNPYGALHRAPDLVALTLLVTAVGVRMAGRQLSYLRVAAVLVVSHVAVHTLLSLSVERPAPGQVWTYRPDAPVPDLVPDAQVEVRVHALNLAVTLAVAAALCALDASLWAWFRLVALRLLCRIPDPCRCLAPERPSHRVVFEEPTRLTVRLLHAPQSRRGPPVVLAG